MTDIKTIREEFKKLVIMGNHPECETYEEALERDWVGVEFECDYCEEYSEVITYQDITLARVMRSLWSKHMLLGFSGHPDDSNYIAFSQGTKFKCLWQLTKDGQECVDDDQSDETIISLYNLLKND